MKVDEDVSRKMAMIVGKEAPVPEAQACQSTTSLTPISFSLLKGAQASEVAISGTLTSNLHILLASFYRPSKTRFKILFEEKAFPSDQVGKALVLGGMDNECPLVHSICRAVTHTRRRARQYAFASQAEHHNLSPADVLLPLAPRKGEFTLRTEDILKVIETQGDEIAVIIFSGVQYYTGQWFEMEKITKAGRKKVRDAPFVSHPVVVKI
jgi:kynureninase